MPNLLKSRIYEGASANFEKHLEIPSVQLMNTLTAAVWIVSLDFIIEYANPSMCNLLGYKINELLNHDIHEFMDPQDKAIVHKRMKDRAQGQSESYPYKLRRKDGTTINVTVSANALYNSANKIIGSLGVFTENYSSAALPKPESTPTPKHLTFANLTLHPESIEYSIDNQRFEISHFSFKLLSYFVEHQGRVISRAEIIDNVWGGSTSDRVIDAHIVALRKKLKNLNGTLKMVYGLGYMLKPLDSNKSNMTS